VLVLILAESYIHTLDPDAVRITDSFTIKWYGLSYLAGFLVAWWLIRWLAGSGRILLSRTDATDFITYCVGGVLVGGRLGYCLFYDPSLLIDFSANFPFWGLFAIHQGGMASHGGMIGVIFAMLLFSRSRKLPFLHLLDVTAFIAPPGLFFGRLANFINGELWGVALPDSMQASPPWWSVKYPQEIQSAPVEAITSLNTTVLQSTATAGMDPVRTIVEEVYRGNSELVNQMAPYLVARWPSQLFQAASDGPALFIALALVWLVPRKPGVIAGCFLFFYGVLRIMTEVFREPDEGVALFLSLSRGQVLSVGLVVAGILLVACARLRSVDPVGGLRTVEN
jgi:phosphatidylglycerol:prolipoprotein diacylglycerol transferase